MLDTAQVPDEGPNFAAIAVELRLSELSMTELSFALLLEAYYCQKSFAALEQLGIKSGLPIDTVRRVLLDPRERVRLIAESHQVIKALIPHEAAVKQLIEQGQDKSPAAPWRRMLNVF
jgi:hypothetical protein